MNSFMILLFSARTSFHAAISIFSFDDAWGQHGPANKLHNRYGTFYIWHDNPRFPKMLVYWVAMRTCMIPALKVFSFIATMEPTKQSIGIKKNTTNGSLTNN